MFQYQDLTQPKTNLYIKVPAQSRKQSFIMYQTEDQNALTEFENSFDHQYLTFNDHQKTIILIPFQHEVSAEQFENLNLPNLDEHFTQFNYGHTLRKKSQNPIHFELHQGDHELIDPLKYVNNQSFYINPEKLKEALKSFIETHEFNQLIKNPLKLRQFLHSLANDIYKNIYTQSDLDLVLSELKPHIKELKKVYNTCYDEISNSSALRNKTKPFGQYIKMYQTNHGQAENISNQMLSMLDKDFEPNPKLALSIAGDLISQIYPPALIVNNGKDRDNIVIFNPLEGIWVHDENIFYSLLTAVRPYSKPSDLTTMMSTFAAKARNQNSFINPYHQSRHLLFKNTMLDLKTMLQYPLDNDEVKNKKFTERMRININYDPQITQAPDFPGRLSDESGNGIWDPYTFLMAYADNDKEKLNFLLFGLSLGLFPGHNFGIHFDIRGESRWGKTTLSEIFKGLFPGRVVMQVFAKLNEQFGLTNFKPETSIIWIRECNDDAPALNNEYGVQVYDGLADNNAAIQVKGKDDLELSNPPQMFIDGTSYVRAKNLDTGPAGRTMVYKLPMEDDSVHPINDLIKQAYAKGISDLLHDETVLQFLVNLMIEAYKTTLKIEDKDSDECKLWNLQLNLGPKSADLKLLPSFEKQWKDEMVNTQGGDIREWFEYDFMPYLCTDPNKPTKMHDTLAYNFYTKDYQNKYSHSDPNSNYKLSPNSFVKQFNRLLSQNHFDKSNVRESNGRLSRQSNKYIDKLNFDIESFMDDGHEIPEEYTNQNINAKYPINHYPLAQKVSGWYKITKHRPESNDE